MQEPDLNTQRFRNILYAFVVLFPLSVVPEHALKDILYPSSPFILPNSELIQLFPRLVLLAVIVLLSWRFWAVRSLFPILLLGHLVLVIVSVFNAHDPDGLVYSLLGPQRRLDGLVYQVLLVGFALAAAGLFAKTKQATRGVAWTFIGAASLQTLIVLLQRLGLDPVGPLLAGGSYMTMRGTMGHPGYVAGLLLAAILLGFGTYFGPGGARRGVLAGLVLFMALGLGATGNRATFYALVAVLVVAVLLLRRWRGMGGAVLVVVLVLLGDALPRPAAPGTAQNAAEPTYTNTRTLENRFAIWQLAGKALRTIPGAPWVGGGPDAFRLALLQDVPMDDILPVIAREHHWPDNARVDAVTVVDNLGPNLRDVHYDLRFATFGDEENVVKGFPSTLDKAHSYLFDRLLAYGLFDVLIWLVIFAYPVVRLFGRGGLERGLFLALLGMGIYYLVWFPVLQLEPLHMVLVAAAWVLAARGETGLAES